MKTKIAQDPEEINLISLAQNYSDEDKARTLLESIRWPDGAVCPHCKCKHVYALKPRASSKSPGRKGLYCCAECRKQFTVKVGTIFEDSHIPLAKWLMAYFILCSSKKAISAHQIHRMLKITYKSSWFMCHRIRHSMSTGPINEMLKGTVEVDETFVGGKPRPGDPKAPMGKDGYRKDSNKIPVVALVERDGNVRTKVVASVSHKNLREFVTKNIDKASTVETDQYAVYHGLFYNWKKHGVVNHSAGEYARTNPDGSVSHCNTAESFFSLIKRGVYGSFHHVSPEHLHRYCEEFSFRWNHRKVSDGERMVSAIEQTEGKRLTYRQAI